MSSSSNSSSSSTSQEYNNSLNTTVANTVGQSGVGVSLGSLSAPVSNTSLKLLTDVGNSTFNITNSSSRSSNIGSGSSSATGATVPTTLTSSTGFDWSQYFPYILLAFAGFLAYLIVKRS